MKLGFYARGAIAASLLSLAAVSQAALITASGFQCSSTQSGSGCVENVLFNNLPAAFSTEPGNPIYGRLNQSDEIIRFSSDELLAIQGGGQARIEDDAGDGFSLLEIQINDAMLAMGILQFNINALGDTTVDLALTDQLGNITTQMLALSGNGQNIFSSYGTDGDVIALATISVTGNAAIQDVKQVRIDAVNRPATEVPEPATLGLLGLGLLGLRGLRRKRA